MPPPDHSPPPSVVARLASAVLLAVPAVLLTVAAVRYGSGLLAAGAGVGLLGGLLFTRFREVWKPPASGSVILLYLTALGWLWFPTRNDPDAFARFGRGLLLMTSVGLLVGHDLSRTGLGPRRKARGLCRRLAARTHWPAVPAEYAQLPEVRALRGLVRDDPSPILGLVTDPRPEVRAAGFMALHGRPHWRAVEAQAVLVAGRQGAESWVRAAALEAVSGADDGASVAEVGAALRDGSRTVRAAAAAAILAGGARRWPAAREFVRLALSDPARADDGAFPGSAGRLPAVAVCDLFTWAAEVEPLAGRAVRTLVAHYAELLRIQALPGLPAELGELAVDPLAPPALRAEVAWLLREFGLLTPALLDRLTDADQPSPVRLLAAEALLAARPDDADALEVLRGLGRQSNRDTALAIAQVLQFRLGLDMGLPTDGPVAPAGRVAAEAARRVLAWAGGGAAPVGGPRRLVRPTG